MSLDRPSGKVGSQESVNSWEWVETTDGSQAIPEWVEIAKQRQRLRKELAQMEEEVSYQSSVTTSPSWRTEVRLRETPGVPVKHSAATSPLDDHKAEPRFKARQHQAKSFPIDTFPTPVKAEWLQKVQLKKTSHLTKVKGPEVGRVLNEKEKEQPRRPVNQQLSSEKETKYSFSASPTKFIYDTGRVSPVSRSSPRRRNQSEITVDHVLSSIRLIRQASLSASDLTDFHNTRTVSPTLRGESPYRSSSLASSHVHRASSPSPKDPDKPSFYSTPQWILDLKVKKQQRRVKPSDATKYEKEDEAVHVEIPRMESGSPTSIEKSATWSTATSRRQFRSVLNEMRSVNRDESSHEMHYRPRYHTHDFTPVTRKNELDVSGDEHKLEISVARESTSVVSVQRSTSPTTSKTNDESGVSHEPLMWWIQIPESKKQQDLDQREKKFQTFVNKKISSLSQTSNRPRQPSPALKESPIRKQSFTIRKRSPSPSNRKFSSSTKEQQHSVTVSPKRSNEKQPTTPTSRSPLTSPTRRSPTGSARGKSPAATSRSRSPQTSPSPPSTPSKPTPKTRTQVQRSPAKSKTPSPKPTTKTTSKTMPPTSAKTEITVGVNRAVKMSGNLPNKSSTPNTKSSSPDLTKKRVSPPKSPALTPKTQLPTSKSSSSIKQTTSIHITSTHSTVVDARGSSPSPTSTRDCHSTISSTSANRGRFSQLLSDLSKSNLERSQSLRSDESLSREKSTFPLRFHDSSSSFADSSNLVRQVSTSTRSLNIRKPRVRFSSTEIVWPLDLEGHAPVTTCHHPVQAAE